MKMDLSLELDDSSSDRVMNRNVDNQQAFAFECSKFLATREASCHHSSGINGPRRCLSVPYMLQ